MRRHWEVIEEICPGAKLGKIEVTFGTGEGKQCPYI